MAKPDKHTVARSRYGCMCQSSSRMRPPGASHVVICGSRRTRSIVVPRSSTMRSNRPPRSGSRSSSFWRRQRPPFSPSRTNSSCVLASHCRDVSLLRSSAIAPTRSRWCNTIVVSPEPRSRTWGGVTRACTQAAHQRIVGQPIDVHSRRPCHGRSTFRPSAKNRSYQTDRRLRQHGAAPPSTAAGCPRAVPAASETPRRAGRGSARPRLPRRGTP